MWDGWAAALSKSHEKTARLLETGKAVEAHAEYRERFLVTVKEVYSEAAVVSPQRFSESKNWQAWLRHLYALSVAADKALGAGAQPSETRTEDAAPHDAAVEALEKLRGHFYRLRLETDTRESHDFIYAIHIETLKDKPEAKTLDRLRAALEKAEPGQWANADPKAYRKAWSDWRNKVAPILNDGSVAPGEIESLRAATLVFHHAFGARI